MKLKTLFNTDAACAAHVRSLIRKLAAARRATRRRDRRIRRLLDVIRDERARHAAVLASQDELIDAFKEELLLRPRIDPAAARDAEALERDLATALTMLDEFEKDACRTRAAQTRIADLEAQARVHEQLIADLEDELAMWRTAGRDAA